MGWGLGLWSDHDFWSKNYPISLIKLFHQDYEILQTLPSVHSYKNIKNLRPALQVITASIGNFPYF